MTVIQFVPETVVLRIHDDQIREYGGMRGLRDPDLLDSALHMPLAQVGGVFLHETIGAMAAAYGYHICKNHAFADGNKRTAYTVMVTFLELNGLTFERNNTEHYEAMMAVSEGRMNKETFTKWVEGIISPVSKE